MAVQHLTLNGQKFVLMPLKEWQEKAKPSRSPARVARRQTRADADKRLVAMARRSLAEPGSITLQELKRELGL